MYETQRFIDRPLHQATKVAATIWVILTTVNFAIWLTVCVGTFSFDYPWWIWVFTSLGILTGGLKVASHMLEGD